MSRQWHLYSCPYVEADGTTCGAGAVPIQARPTELTHTHKTGLRSTKNVDMTFHGSFDTKTEADEAVRRLRRAAVRAVAA